jgi:hypothetical protein
MKSLKRNLLGIVALTILSIVTFNSCRKVDNLAELSKSDAASMEKAKQNIKTQIDQLGGIPEKVEVNQRMQMAYADMDGNILNSLPANTGNSLVSACVGDLPDYLDLGYYYRLYTCGIGYKIKFSWTISWSNNVVLQNPFNAANRTRGTIRVSVTGNPNAYVNTTTDVQIFDSGTDPNNPANNIFVVHMTSTTLVPVAVVNAPGATLRLGAFFASDCPTLDNYSVVPMSVSGFGFVSPLNNNPCNRNDKAWHQPQYINPVIEIAGYDPLGTCPSYDPASAPSMQEVQYSLDNGLSYVPYTNYSYGSPLINTSYVLRWEFARSETIAPGTYNLKIRYRNIKYFSNVSGYPIPTSTNACINPVWTVESFPGTTIN